MNRRLQIAKIVLLVLTIHYSQLSYAIKLVELVCIKCVERNGNTLAMTYTATLESVLNDGDKINFCVNYSDLNNKNDKPINNLQYHTDKKKGITYFLEENIHPLEETIKINSLMPYRASEPISITNLKKIIQILNDFFNSFGHSTRVGVRGEVSEMFE